MVDGKIASGSEYLPFQTVLSSIRRKKFLDAFMAQDADKKAEGQKIMKAYGKYQAQKKGGGTHSSQVKKSNTLKTAMTKGSTTLI